MNTIKSSSDITYLFEHGRRIKASGLNLIVARTKEQHDQTGRVAFIAGKRNGNAVWRNRAKRRMRSLCFDLGGPFPELDVVFLARNTINDLPYEELLDNARHALSKFEVLSEI